MRAQGLCPPLGLADGAGATTTVVVIKSQGPGQPPTWQPALQKLELGMVSLKTCLLPMWLSEERVVCPLSIFQASEGRLELLSTSTCCPGPGGAGELRWPSTRLTWAGVNSVLGRLRGGPAGSLTVRGASGLPWPESGWGAVGMALGPQASPYVLLAPTTHPRQSTGSSLRRLNPSSGEGSSQHQERSDQCKEQQLQKLPMLVRTS